MSGHGLWKVPGRVMLAWALGAAAGCAPERPAFGQSCSGGEDCEDGTKCLDGQCVPSDFCAGEDSVGLSREGTSAGEQRRDPTLCLLWAWMPAGSFHFGCEPQDSQCEADEQPGRTEQVGGFWMMQTEVTVNAYAQCKAAGACVDGTGAGPEPDHPVTDVNWTEATTLCEWVGGRLPTAVEWEYAAKSGSSRIYPWGDEPPDGTRANCSSCGDLFSRTAPVRSFPAGDTPWGLKDMAGNVWEWTGSPYDSSYIEVRGGSWFGNPTGLRAGGRRGVVPGFRGDYVGFRCAQQLQVYPEL